MDLDNERESNNVEDMRGQGGGSGFPGMGGGGLNFGGGKLGCGGIVIVIVLALIFGVNPLTLLGGGGGGQAGGPQQQIGQPAETGAPARSATDMDRFVSRVLATTEDTWTAIFEKEVGKPYRAPKLVLFTDSVRSGCGAAESAMGPFYCPADQKVYLDQSFFDELARRFGAPGDFAAAYVIAHEIGHHVQTLIGISDQVEAAQRRASKTQGNAL
ncbi:MAG: neutral zinc metallopeptidase, partial [Sandarakinorhabdus sp.]|nr:neutral zinc metallopeptidase [Sandarakinorhabdus sp.]